MRQLCLQTINDPCLIPLAHLGIERQQDALILGEFGLSKIMARSLVPVGSFAVRAHDAATRRDALVEQALHYRALVESVRQTHAIALPIGAGPAGLGRQPQAFEVAEQLAVAGCDGPAPGDPLR